MWLHKRILHNRPILWLISLQAPQKAWHRSLLSLSIITDIYGGTTGWQLIVLVALLRFVACGSGCISYLTHCMHEVAIKVHRTTCNKAHVSKLMQRWLLTFAGEAMGSHTWQGLLANIAIGGTCMRRHVPVVLPRQKILLVFCALHARQMQSKWRLATHRSLAEDLEFWFLELHLAATFLPQKCHCGKPMHIFLQQGAHADRLQLYMKIFHLSIFYNFPSPNHRHAGQQKSMAV